MQFEPVVETGDETAKEVTMKFSHWISSTLILGSLAASELALAKDGVTRAEAVKAFDFNEDTRLDKAEVKAFKAKHPRMHENLMGFCKVAKKDPQSMGVKLPPASKRQQRHCKKRHIARSFLIAWMEQDPKTD